MEASSEQKLLFSNRALVSLAIPIAIDALLAIVAGMVDSAMVSSAGEAAVSAISLVDQLCLLFITAFSAIINGGVVVTTQYIGSRNYPKARVSANQLLYASTAIATVISVSMLCLIPQLLQLVYGSIAADVFENAKAYFFYVLLGFPFYAVGASCTSLLRGMARSKPALLLPLSINLLNVVGNAVLIYGFGMGAAGAAISTSFSRVVYAVAGLLIMHRKSLPVYFENLLKFRLDFDVLRRILPIGLGNGLESGLFQMGKILVASLVSSFGTIAIAANSVASTLCNIGWTVVGSLGTVLLTVVGQCIGAGEPDQARMYTKRILKLGHILVLILFGSVFLLRHQLVLLFDFGPEALEASAYYTGVGALLTIFSGYANCFLPVSAFRAAGDIRYAVILAVASMFTFRVGLSYLLGSFLGMGLLGVWIGIWADWLCRTIFNTVRFRGSKWIHAKVI